MNHKGLYWQKGIINFLQRGSDGVEIVKYTPKEIDEAIEGLDGLQQIIVPILRKSFNGMADHGIQQFKRHIMMAKHALIAMGQFMETD
jgi:hypothetical protein